MKRDTTIALSDEEKERLNEIATMVFDDPDAVPYGDVLALLIDSYQRDDSDTQGSDTDTRLAQA